MKYWKGMMIFGCMMMSLFSIGEKEITLTQMVTDPVFHRLCQTSNWYRLDAAKMSLDGAYAANKLYALKLTNVWWIEEQRYAVDTIEAYINLKDASYLSNTFKLLDWGFSKQLPSGGFDCQDAFHSTSFFLEAVGRVLILCQESKDPIFKEVLKTYLPKYTQAMIWMKDPALVAKNQSNESRYTHRKWVMAATMGYAAELTGEKEFAAEALRYAKEGSALQSTEGWNPEKGGFDINYNSVGLCYAEYYYSTLKGPQQSEGRALVAQMLKKSLEWEKSKVATNGELNVMGSTRVNNENTRSGVLKTPSYNAASRAFALGFQILDKLEYREISEKLVAFHYHVEVGK